jgi:hypothetical protein
MYIKHYNPVNKSFMSIELSLLILPWFKPGKCFA